MAEVAVQALCDAGRLVRIARAGQPPLGDDDAIELLFDSGAVFHIDTGPVGASDVVIRTGALLDRAYGHLRDEEPETWNDIAGDWTHHDITPNWATGAPLIHPRRLTMTRPYRLDIGYALNANGRELALCAEADLLFATALDDPAIASFGLTVSARP